uniref:Uncharacterized protein n=1 Tax=viral metagenome TaxID=1070528 RepID=A0A6H1ZZZ6_9ZZZZ
MLPRKTGKPIAIKCTEQLRQQTEAIADSLGESLSEYVRKAIEQRNAQYNNPGIGMGYVENGEIKIKPAASKPTIESVAEKAVSKIERPKMVKSFMKEGKK